MPAFVKFVNGKLYGGGRALSTDLGTEDVLSSGTSGTPVPGQIIAQGTATTGTDTTVTSSTNVATGLSPVTFTVPASGKVQVDIQMPFATGAASQTIEYILYDDDAAAAVEAKGISAGLASGVFGIGNVSFIVTGLTPGATKTYSVRVSKTAGTGNITVYHGNAAGEARAVMTVRVPF